MQIELRNVGASSGGFLGPGEIRESFNFFYEILEPSSSAIKCGATVKYLSISSKGAQCLFPRGRCDKTGD